MNIPTDILYPLQAAMEQWTDGRCILMVDLETLLMFSLYLPVVLSRAGYGYCGHIFKRVNMSYRLTVKVLQEKAPLVVFITASTTIGCMHKFLDLWEDDRLVWVSDKYPWI